MKQIAISSGHGLHIRGATPPYMDEVDEARKVVAQVATELRALGATVRGPFGDDVSTTQNENLNRIVNWHNSQQRDLDVSVHFNANAPTSNPMGTEVLYTSQEVLARDVSAAIAQAGGLKNRGPKHRTDLFFLNNTHEPAILIEVCFVDSTTDRDLYRQNFLGICKAIAAVLAGQAAGKPGDMPVLSNGDTGAEVVRVQTILGLPSDGQYGPITQAGVAGFQRAWALQADGVVGPATWASLNDLEQRMLTGSSGISAQLEREIDMVAGRSLLDGYQWADRGIAPSGYIAGMGKSFALALTLLRIHDPAVIAMAQADTQQPDTDALSWYAAELGDEGLDISRDGVETLRALFVLQFGLGMRESSGNHWVGRDMSATNTQSDTAEAGLFQASWNLSTASSEMNRLMKDYEHDPQGFLQTFSRGVAPTTTYLDNFGSGDGCYYQWLAKYSPAFAVLTTALGLRKRRQHWGPINRREVDVVQMVDEFLIDVELATVEPPSV